MTTVSTTLPDPRRDGVGVILSSEWSLGTPERQLAAAEATVRVWRDAPWPDGLISYTLLLGTDGDRLMHYSQYRDEAAYEAFAAEGRGPKVAEIDAAVPGIERLGLGRFRLYRSGRSDDDARVPGCIVAVHVDTDDARTAEAWVDSVFDALDTDPNPHGGGIGAYFHISTDGTRVLNYAEWVDEQSHIDALAGPGNGVGSARTPQWNRVQNTPGVRHVAVRRFTPYRTLTA
ncbi:antibiotic biosynthesis monooxygenase [Herbihabitans rhizosphaerae]|uniref:Antibiotic biosynthesis monooxygenase n=1 Tax=Herbihabitans rhizosphaerae TaxID=1872711 RepID=A0A4Q7L388_9PSEU|nr:antibiotic biosynthesis monooxygenase [Herbihabitans rhizosphaerae]RZS43606.1 antibiotic biosynthesis monooxygenase [Herbihabitans rhizosphaerae]